MCIHRLAVLSLILVLFASLGPFTAADVCAQDALRIYGPVGPSPAIEEAAMVFANRHDVDLQVTTGPRHIWHDKAPLDADLMFSDADFMMSDYVRSMGLQLDMESVTPLYLRPSAILVRPGNPKQITDFPDLVRPGLKIMVVNDAGHIGLWEDMAGKLQDIRTLRALRKNIAVFAASSDEAVRLWEERPDIDAWITWNTWHIPLRGRAMLVPVSETYRVLRQCSIAITARGKSNPLAAEFASFLASPEAGAIFDSWGWLTHEAGARPLTVDTDIAIVCGIDEDKWKGAVGEGLASLQRLLQDYMAIGMSPEEVHISAIFHGDAAYWLLKDEPYRASAGKEQANPNKLIIRELTRMGVSLEMCALTMKEHGWTRNDILPEVKIVPAAYPRLIDLEQQGYAWVRF